MDYERRSDGIQSAFEPPSSPLLSPVHSPIRPKPSAFAPVGGFTGQPRPESGSHSPISSAPPRPLAVSPRPGGSGAPYIGVELTDVEIEHGPVVVTTRVVPAGPCAQAGVRTGDVWKSWNGIPLRAKRDAAGCVARSSPGDEVHLVIARPPPPGDQYSLVNLRLVVEGAPAKTPAVLAPAKPRHSVDVHTQPPPFKWRTLESAYELFKTGKTPSIDWIAKRCVKCHRRVEGRLFKYEAVIGTDPIDANVCEDCVPLMGQRGGQLSEVSSAQYSNWIGWMTSHQSSRPLSLRALLHETASEITCVVTTQLETMEWVGSVRGEDLLFVVCNDKKEWKGMSCRGRRFRRTGVHYMEGIWEWSNVAKGKWKMMEENAYLRRGLFLHAVRQGDWPTAEVLLRKEIERKRSAVAPSPAIGVSSDNLNVSASPVNDNEDERTARKFINEQWGACLPLVDACTIPSTPNALQWEIHHDDAPAETSDELAVLKQDELHRPYHITIPSDRRLALIEALLRRGASPREMDGKGKLPLVQICLALSDGLAAGGSVSVAPATLDAIQEGMGALQTQGNSNAQRIAGPIVSLLLRHGASPTQPDRLNLRPLHAACYAKASHIVEILLTGKGDNGRLDNIDAYSPFFSFEGVTALHIAALMGDAATAEHLLKHGANVHSMVRGRSMAKTLHLSCLGVQPLWGGSNAPDCLKVLLAHGAHTDIDDVPIGNTAIELVKMYGLTKHERLLRQHSAHPL